ncbi:MAG: hypothetical protein R3236_03365 [Phycisphaeraceae bacterium]|nr:hypothetical protein [Phycisphaeraceae bacterium]
MAMSYMMGLMPMMLMAMVGGGGIPAPISIPPLPENAKFQAAAPEAPILYVSWAGTAKADPASKNNTEKLFAEPQVRQMMHKLIGAITRGIEQEMRGEDPGAAKATTALLKAAYYRPGMAYLSHFEADQQGGFKVDGAWLMDAGENVEQMTQSIKTLLALMPKAEVHAQPIGPFKPLPTPQGAPVVRWGVSGSTIVFTLGDREPKRLIEALKNGKEPKWMTALKKSADIERRALIGRADLAAMIKMTNDLGKQDRDFQEFSQFLKAVGADSFKTVSLVSGLDQSGYVERMVIDTGKKKPTGLMKLMAGTPIAAAQIRHVPKDVFFMNAFNMDLKVAYEEMRSVIGSMDPDALNQFDAGVAELEQNLGVKFKKGVMDHLGPTWTFYNSGEDNGLFMTGLTATVEVRNRAGIDRAMRQIIASLRAQMQQPQEDQNQPWRRQAVQIRESTYRSHTIYYMNYVGGFGFSFPLAWTVTERTVAMGLNPQSIRTHIDQVVDDNQKRSITTLPKVMALLKAEDLPSAITYADTPRVFHAAYPTLHFMAMLIVPQLQRQGIDIDATFLPNTAVIMKHLTTHVQTISHADGKIVIQTRGVLPVSGGGGALIIPALLITSNVAVARDARPVRVHEAPVHDAKKIVRPVPKRAIEKKAVPVAP